jgi:DNA-binding MarR family transcriptional regulator
VVKVVDASKDAAALAVELRLAMRRVRVRVRAETTSEGWTISQLATLSRIINDGPITASELAQAEHVRPQSIAEIVTALKAGGLVAAKPDPNDGRKWLLRATAAGRRLIEAVTASREAWLVDAIEAVVPLEERASLASAVELLNRLADCDVHAGRPSSDRR